MTNWISVKDRLPEDQSTVLVYMSFVFKEYKVAFYNKGNFYSYSVCDNYITRAVTHWQPLPEPPNE